MRLLTILAFTTVIGITGCEAIKPITNVVGGVLNTAKTAIQPVLDHLPELEPSNLEAPPNGLT